MANEPIHGKGGKAKFDVVEFENETAWSISLSVDTSDSTAMHLSNTGRTREAGIKRGTADVTCYYKANVNPEVLPVVAEGTLELWRISGDATAGYYTGTAKCTGYDIDEPKDGVVSIIYHFVFTGAVTIVTI